ncbi:MAG: DUF177 domain-containing protein [Acidobacteria bacterium]|nr:DUF177 domain-containing protein [Acidobacteriota bacterium]
MYIDLSQIEQDELHVAHQYQKPFELQSEDVRVTSAPAIELQVQRAAAREFRVRGHLAATVGVACDRCLIYYSLPIAVSFDLFCVPIETLTPEEDMPLTPKDLDYGFYRDNLLDVDALVREQIFLALPFRSLCRLDCRGLCPQCGVDLNRETCTCEVDEVALYWSALRNLKKSN